MADIDTQATPAPMEGHGAYNRNSRVQAAGLSSAIPMLGEAASEVALAPGPEPIVIADYGSSEGHNSLLPMAEAIGALRKRVGAARAISVVHTDLPSSDFSGLFETLASDPASNLRDDPCAFASAVGRSFYEQLLPSGSVFRWPIAATKRHVPPSPSKQRKTGAPSSPIAGRNCVKADGSWC